MTNTTIMASWADVFNVNPDNNDNDEPTVMLPVDIIERIAYFRRLDAEHHKEMKIDNYVDTASIFDSLSKRIRLQTEWERSSMLAPADFKLARDVREYFEVKYFNKKMLGHTLTDFQRNIVALLKNRRQIKMKNLGAAIKLFDFYAEDVYTDAVVEKYDSLPNPNLEYYKPVDEITVSLHGVLNAKRKRSHYHKLITHTNDNKVVIINKSAAGGVEDNGLEFLLENFSTVTLQGRFSVGNFNDHEFYYHRLDKPRVVGVTK